MQFCEVFDLCGASGWPRACGHVACNDCVDPVTNVCLTCVPHEPNEYLQFVLLEECREQWPLAAAQRWAIA
jgi:hypothetical protein